jgi:hypothetical protein
MLTELDVQREREGERGRGGRSERGADDGSKGANLFLFLSRSFLAALFSLVR